METKSSSNGNNKKRKNQWKDGSQYKKSHSMEQFQSGIKGFLLTCNNREVECLRESYNILNEYIDKYETENSSHISLFNPVTNSVQTNYEDIPSAIENEIKSIKEKRLRQVATKCKNILFVHMTAVNYDPLEIVSSIFSDIERSGGKQKARFILKLIPVQITCKATTDAVTKCVSDLLDQMSSGDAEVDATDESTFQILCKIRCNNDAKRMDFIESAAKVIKTKRNKWKVNFDEPKYTFSIDVIIKNACLSIMTDFFKYKKYNMIEYANSLKKSSPVKEATETPTESIRVEPHVVTEDVPTESPDVTVQSVEDANEIIDN